jgi:hypothetical protein
MLQPPLQINLPQRVPNLISLFGSTTFEVSKDGIKINSAVIGLIILAISIAFFFLYPVNVIRR